jgi:hypothetical protein
MDSDVFVGPIVHLLQAVPVSHEWFAAVFATLEFVKVVGGSYESSGIIYFDLTDRCMYIMHLQTLSPSGVQRAELCSCINSLRAVQQQQEEAQSDAKSGRIAEVSTGYCFDFLFGF